MTEGKLDNALREFGTPIPTTSHAPDSSWNRFEPRSETKRADRHMGPRSNSRAPS